MSSQCDKLYSIRLYETYWPNLTKIDSQRTIPTVTVIRSNDVRPTKMKLHFLIVVPHLNGTTSKLQVYSHYLFYKKPLYCETNYTAGVARDFIPTLIFFIYIGLYTQII